MIITTIIFFVLEIITFPLIPLRVLIMLKVKNVTFTHIFFANASFICNYIDFVCNKSYFYKLIIIFRQVAESVMHGLH